ncbi:MAG: DUF4404 family protein [Acaryochloridaceae cyanobacterium SU_2_1]|nr:DUF4404 family protein [Acaryochloridaceae cyanobacterium SU_2_1]
MSKEDILKSLQLLRAELAKLEGADAQTLERLALLIKDVERQVDNPESHEQREALVQNLPVLIEQFEVDHPQMTETLNQILMTLSGMGI